MALSDEEFREAFKPLQVPADYSAAKSQQDEILFALAQLGEGTSRDVTDQLVKLEPRNKNDQLFEQTDELLKSLFEKGLLNGGDKNGELYYNLSKVTHANNGTVDPDLLLPAVD
jgi:hypothetical protein